MGFSNGRSDFAQFNRLDAVDSTPLPTDRKLAALDSLRILSIPKEKRDSTLSGRFARNFVASRCRSIIIRLVRTRLEIGFVLVGESLVRNGTHALETMVNSADESRGTFTASDCSIITTKYVDITLSV